MDETIKQILKLNVQRTQYILWNYHKYLKLADENAKAVSFDILGILAESLRDNPRFPSADKKHIDNCGPKLCHCIQQLIEELKDYPLGVGQTIYPVVWVQYMDADGPTNIKELGNRLQKIGVNLDHGQIVKYLKKGEKMLASLIFGNRELSAIAFACGNI